MNLTDCLMALPAFVLFGLVGWLRWTNREYL